MYKYKCDVCGRPLKKKHSIQGYTLCSKHMHQLIKHGKFLDNIQRSNNDRNDYIVDGDIAIFNLYNQKNIKIEEFIIDAEDINKVKYHKWRLSHNHVVTGRKQNGVNNVKDLSWIILDIDDITGLVVDHINHNPLDNRKENLRLCTQSENTKNVSIYKNNTSGYIGVFFNKRRGKWCAELKYNYKKIHLGEYRDKEKAVYARMIGEELFFQGFVNQEELENKLVLIDGLDIDSKKEICSKITKKYIDYTTQNT